MSFKFIGSFDHEPIFQELQNATLWNWLSVRRSRDLKHKSVDDIVLRFQSVEGKHDISEYFDKMECVDYFPKFYFPKTSKVIHDFADKSTIGRIVIAKLKAGGVIDTHIDKGEYCAAHDRFHFVVSTNPDVWFKCNGSVKRFEAGKIWWLDNKSLHSIENNGSADRIHIVVDIKKEQCR